jgi:fibro-slime domain-containing protein
MIQGSLAGLMACALAASAPAQAGDTLTLHGTARDFTNAHVDFSVIPSAGFGHYAGNVGMSLDGDACPVFENSGFLVAEQWLDNESRPIPPHLFMEGGESGIYLQMPASVHDKALLDSWDSTAGPYGGTNVGPAPPIYVGSEMPELSVPDALSDLPFEGDVTLEDGTLSSDRNCRDVNVAGDVLVAGHVSLLVQGEFRLDTNSSVELMDGASLTVYATGGVHVQPHSTLNGTSDDPKRVMIYNIGNAEVRLSQPHGVVYAQVVSPDAPMRVQPNGQFFGTFIGETLILQPNSAFHADMLTASVCGASLNDEAGSQGAASSGGISSASSFTQWYTDVLGVNLAEHHAITLERDDEGVWEYLDDAFYPLDGRGFGNGNLPHNYYFTYTIDASFTYEGCGGQFVEFVGCDDMWLFVDGNLVMDLGGVLPAMTQRVDVDRLGLEDGQTYSVQLFYAQRQANHGVFRLRTNIDFVSTGENVSVSGVFD